MQCPACYRDTDLVRWTSAEGRIVGHLCPECLSTVLMLKIEADARQLAADEEEAILREEALVYPTNREQIRQLRRRKKNRNNGK